ncbi:MAG TPA: DUF3043 domain-containing protein [Actinomycetales bacterium]|nr:DUF3043 domain-containing protein [Actinomycetales bacterium]
MFRRKKSQETPPTPEVEERPGSKGRPTPKRAEAEARNRRPLVPDRSTARKSQRQANANLREKQRQALMSGDEKAMPPRDRGPVRRWARDYVDARWNIGEFFLPVALVVVIAVLFVGDNPLFAFYTIIALYAIVLVSVIDAIILGRFLKKGLRSRFGEDKIPSGTVMYGVMRAFQIRRTRLPKPKVGRGEYPNPER